MIELTTDKPIQIGLNTLPNEFNSSAFKLVDLSFLLECGICVEKFFQQERVRSS